MQKKFKRHRQCFVYIAECRDGTYYTGYTSNLEKRIEEHNDGKRGARYLRGKSPVKLVWCREYRYFKNAMKAEVRIKKLTRAEKQELIRIYEESKSRN